MIGTYIVETGLITETRFGYLCSKMSNNECKMCIMEC